MQRRIVVVICFLLLTGTLRLATLVDARPPQQLARPLSGISREITGWQGVDDPPLEQEVEDQLKASDHILRTYRSAGNAIGLFVAYYSRQADGRNIHPPKNCLPGNGWNILKNGAARVPFGTQDVSVNVYRIQKGDQRRQVLYWYQSADRIVASEYAAKALLFWDALYKGDTSGSVVRIIVCDEPESLKTGIRFAGTVMSEVERCLGRPKGSA